MSKDRSRRKQPQITQPKTRATTTRRVQRQSTNLSRRRPAQQVERADSKQAQILRLLHSATGTTIDAMAKATGWQHHSVRGFLSGVVRNKLGLNLISEAGEAGRVYHVKVEKTLSALKV